MSTITFYEKPGCAGNARQRALLEAAGHTLIRRNLLSQAWTADSLLAFLAPLPVRLWFNRAAPRIKRGELNPDTLDAASAIAELLAEPLLIRRPLMLREDGARMVGFDVADVQRFLGTAIAAETDASLEACAIGRTAGPCR